MRAFLIMLGAVVSGCGGQGLTEEGSFTLAGIPATGGKAQCPSVRVTETSGEAVNVRSAPRKSSDVVSTANEGEVFPTLDVNPNGELVGHDVRTDVESRAWYKVMAQPEGWMTAVFLECVPGSVGGGGGTGGAVGAGGGGGGTVVVVDPGTGSAGDWVWPVTGTKTLNVDNWKVSLGFGVTGVAVGHLGNDFGRGSNLNRPVYAVADGTVAYIHQISGSNWVDFPVVRHNLATPTSFGDRVIYSRYGHVRAVNGLRVGQAVRKGQVIAHIVENGSFVPHLHFEMCNEACFSIKTLTPGSGYTKSKNYPNAKSFVHAQARYYNPRDFIAADGKM